MSKTKVPPELILDSYYFSRFEDNQSEIKQLTTKEQLFNNSYFKEYKMQDDELARQLLKKNHEGSQGPCKRCKSLNTYLIEIQTRSADEALTIEIHCGDCQKSWAV